MHRACINMSLVLAAVLLCGCVTRAPQRGAAQTPQTATASPERRAADYRALAARGGRALAVDPAASRVRIFVFRGGRVASAGHDHVLTVPVFTGFVYLPAGNVADGRFDLQFRLDQLGLDPPELRRDVGGPFAPPLGEGDIAGTREHMLQSFDAEHFPDVSLSTVRIAGEIPRLVVTVSVSLHGATRQYTLPVRVERMADGLTLRGALAIRQSDFGIAPYSALGGLLAIQDDVSIEFELVTKPL